MYESIILCLIGIVINTSAADYNINRNMCLKTAARFLKNHIRCRFQFGQADTNLKDAETCSNICNVRVYQLDNEYTYYYIRQVAVKIGRSLTVSQLKCQPPHVTSATMYINCSSWNNDKYRVNVLNTIQCQLRYAQCERIDNYCICHCYHEFIMVNGSCLKENVTVGNSCVFPWQCSGTKFASQCNYYGQCECQEGYILNGNNCYRENIPAGHLCLFHSQCTGTEYASVCNNGRCECRSGYKLASNNCYPEYVTVGNSCIFPWQCNGTKFASLCNHYGQCECQAGYILKGNSCYQAVDVPVGHSCYDHWQCTGTQHASVCNHHRCECQSRYILIGNNCYPGHITVNQSCFHNWQCTGTEFASLCTFGVCTCQAGYILIGNNCYPGHVPVGGFCNSDKQCTGSNSSETCTNGRCRCSDKHILLDLECIQVQPNELEHYVRNQQDNNIGKILGTLFGGMLIGVILTAVVALFVFQKMRTKIKRDEPSVSFANDVIYSSANVVEREDITVSQANDREQKVVNVLPYACSGKGAVYSLVTRKPSVEHPTTEGVYNHLHEQEKHYNEHDDNYDHACAASYLGTEPSVYSNMP